MCLITLSKTYAEPNFEQTLEGYKVFDQRLGELYPFVFKECWDDDKATMKYIKIPKDTWFDDPGRQIKLGLDGDLVPRGYYTNGFHSFFDEKDAIKYRDAMVKPIDIPPGFERRSLIIKVKATGITAEGMQFEESGPDGKAYARGPAFVARRIFVGSAEYERAKRDEDNRESETGVRR